MHLPHLQEAAELGALAGLCPCCLALSVASGDCGETESGGPGDVPLPKLKHIGDYELLEEIAHGGCLQSAPGQPQPYGRHENDSGRPCRERDPFSENRLFAVKLRDVDTGREVLTLGTHDKKVHAVAMSPDGKRIASAGNDNVIKLWSLE